MKIDQAGHILLPPVVVRRNLNVFYGAPIAIRNRTASTLLLWVPRENDSDFSRRGLIRSVVDKRTLAAISWDPVPFKLQDPYMLQSTQRGSHDFLMLTFNSYSYRPVIGAAETSPLGVFTGKFWPLTQTWQGAYGAISSDGTGFAWSEYNKLHYRSLNQSGTPVGKTAEFVYRPGHSFGHISISNLIAESRRLLIYITVYSHHCDGIVTVFSRMLNASTGVPLTKPQVLRNGEGECDDPSIPVAIDPKARFYLFTQTYRDRNLDLDNALQFQALDTTGRKLGAPKPIAELLAGGVDLLLEP